MTCNRRKKRSVPSAANAIRFFKIITTTTLEAAKLKIPNGFTKKYGGDMSNPMYLKPPDGTEWKMYWTKHDSDIWFQNGWKEFATNYSLDHGHMVLFEYKDSSHFEVHIFDKSTLEIQYPFQFHGSQENLDKISQDSVEILDELPSSSCKKTKLKSPMSSPQPSKKLKTGTSGKVERSPKLQNMGKHVKIKGSQCQGTNFENSTFASDKEELDNVEQLNSKITQALNRASTFRSKNPSFMVVMKPSYVDQHFLSIPSKFAEKYLKEKRDILLQVLDGRTWCVSYNLGKFNAGWMKFVSDNNLTVGDVCLFELNKRGGLSFKVLIFPLSEVPYFPHSQGDGVSCIDPGGIPDNGGKTVITNRGEMATQQSALHPFINGAMKEASKFTSENPFFIVYVKPDQGYYYRPYVPNAFITKYFNKRKRIVMLQFGKKLWPIKLLYYPRGAKLSEGWSLFARESKLLGGDVCLFELINREDYMLEVHIFRDN